MATEYKNADNLNEYGELILPVAEATADVDVMRLCWAAVNGLSAMDDVECADLREFLDPAQRFQFPALPRSIVEILQAKRWPLPNLKEEYLSRPPVIDFAYDTPRAGKKPAGAAGAPSATSGASKSSPGRRGQGSAGKPPRGASAAAASGAAAAGRDSSDEEDRPAGPEPDSPSNGWFRNKAEFLNSGLDLVEVYQLLRLPGVRTRAVVLNMGATRLGVVRSQVEAFVEIGLARVVAFQLALEWVLFARLGLGDKHVDSFVKMQSYERFRQILRSMPPTKYCESELKDKLQGDVVFLQAMDADLARIVTDTRRNNRSRGIPELAGLSETAAQSAAATAELPARANTAAEQHALAVVDANARAVRELVKLSVPSMECIDVILHANEWTVSYMLTVSNPGTLEYHIVGGDEIPCMVVAASDAKTVAANISRPELAGRAKTFGMVAISIAKTSLYKLGHHWQEDVGTENLYNALERASGIAEYLETSRLSQYRLQWGRVLSHPFYGWMAGFFACQMPGTTATAFLARLTGWGAGWAKPAIAKLLVAKARQDLALSSCLKYSLDGQADQIVDLVDSLQVTVGPGPHAQYHIVANAILPGQGGAVPLQLRNALETHAVAFHGACRVSNDTLRDALTFSKAGKASDDFVRLYKALVPIVNRVVTAESLEALALPEEIREAGTVTFFNTVFDPLEPSPGARALRTRLMMSILGTLDGLKVRAEEEDDPVAKQQLADRAGKLLARWTPLFGPNPAFWMAGDGQGGPGAAGGEADEQNF